VIYAPRDELISTPYLLAYRERSPEAVTLHRLSLSRARRYPHHLAIDPRTMGEAEWTRLTAALSGWLESAPPCQEPHGPAVPSLPAAKPR
jgi:hypothetical protein